MRIGLSLWRVALLALATACTSTPATSPGPGGNNNPPPVTYTPGQSYFGDNDYVEYIAGNLPLIFSAPHGGTLQPSTIAARTAAACGGAATTSADLNTADLALQIRDAFLARTGKYPHIIINRLHRSRMDANREIAEAACGNGQAQEAWRDYHAFIETAKSAIGPMNAGFYTDLHGHGHPIARLELGYDVSAASLRLTDAEIDASGILETGSSIRSFSTQSSLSFSALLRGSTALGTRLAAAGYPSVPSQQDAAPQEGEAYFNGGYSTTRHSCSLTGTICGVQIEGHLTGVRDTPENRAAFATAVAAVYSAYLAPFGIVLP